MAMTSPPNSTPPRTPGLPRSPIHNSCTGQKSMAGHSNPRLDFVAYELDLVACKLTAAGPVILLTC